MTGFGTLFKGIFQRQKPAAARSRESSKYSQQRALCRPKGFQLPEHKQEDSQIDCKLPEELLAEVFKHLSPVDRVRGAACVSQRWQRCSLQPSVWLTSFGLPKPVSNLPGCSSGWALPRLYSALQTRNLLTGFERSTSAGPGTLTVSFFMSAVGLSSNRRCRLWSVSLSQHASRYSLDGQRSPLKFHQPGCVRRVKRMPLHSF